MSPPTPLMISLAGTAVCITSPRNFSRTSPSGNATTVTTGGSNPKCHGPSSRAVLKSLRVRDDKHQESNVFSKRQLLIALLLNSLMGLAVAGQAPAAAF